MLDLSTMKEVKDKQSNDDMEFGHSCGHLSAFQALGCPGLTCDINIVKPRFLFKTVDLWSYIMPIDRYSHTL